MTQHVHILGIGGTFMAGVARLAVELGYRVTGADQALYPPMSTQLEAMGIEVAEGYDPATLDPAPDVVVIGNVMSRGNPCVEYVLSHDLRYTSGPAWIADNVLNGRHVIAIAGTHGKTTVSSLVTWLLEAAGQEPGFLVGGLVENFGVSARLGAGRIFVIEADEYDTAFFDKRSKFVHYHPRTLVINNLEFDHADIFDDLRAIQRQFHHVIRTMPAEALVIRPHVSTAVDELLEMGCWSRTTGFGADADADWRYEWRDGAAQALTLHTPGGGSSTSSTSSTPLLGAHNAANVCAAVAAVVDAGVDAASALSGLPDFANVRRRLELRGEAAEVRVYDDFAHHPTAISATIGALRGAVGRARIVALIEPRSNTMTMGVHKDTLADSLRGADAVAVLVPDTLQWDIRDALSDLPEVSFFADSEKMANAVARNARPGDHLLAMSNGGFGGVHNLLLERLNARQGQSAT